MKTQKILIHKIENLQKLINARKYLLKYVNESLLQKMNKYVFIVKLFFNINKNAPKSLQN